MRCLAIIPARGGSKGIPRKNLAPLAGRPLISYTVQVSLECDVFDRVIVSTDDDEIARVAMEWGAQVPFMRPAELAQDDTPDMPVYMHALGWLESNDGYSPEVVVWLRPTAPLRTVHDINGATKKLIDTGADCVRSVCLVEHHPYWMKRLDGDRLVPLLDEADEAVYYQRQLLPPVYRFNGAVDVTRCKTVIEAGKLYSGDMRGYVMPAESSIDLDSEVDFALLELLMQRRAS